MDAKPKRKNTSDENGIEFVTALSVDECVERLERSATRSVDLRLNVRVNDARFAVDALDEVGTRGLKVVAELHGNLVTQQNDHTLVRAHYHYQKNPWNPTANTMFNGLMALCMGWLVGGLVIIVGGTVSVGILIGIVCAAGTFFVLYNNWDMKMQEYDRHLPDFRAWLHEHLDA